MDVYKLDHILCLNAKLNGDFFCNGFQAPIVQLDRMSAYGADGRRFESCWGCVLYQLRFRFVVFAVLVDKHESHARKVRTLFKK